MKNIPKKQFVGWMLMLLLCISSSAFAQSPKKVTGRVMDAQGELLIGVNVTEAADPSNGVVTDINGTYTITLKSNKPSLRFSYIGFKDKVVAVGSKGVLDVALEEDVAALDEVVVVASERRRKLLWSAPSPISSLPSLPRLPAVRSVTTWRVWFPV